MIVIAGKSDIAVHGLMLAMQYFSLDQIIVVPNKSDQGVDTWQPSLIKKAHEKGVAVKTLADVYESKVDVFLSLEFDQIIKPEKINTDSVYNIHFSKLPRYKGMYTSVWPVLFGDDVSAVTLHKIDQGIDTGDILYQKVFALEEHDRSQDCYRKYLKNAIELLSDNFEKIIHNKITSYQQDSAYSTYYSKASIDYKSIAIDFNKTAWQVKRYVYAFSFRPYQLVSINGKKVTEVKILTTKSLLVPGSLLSENEESLVYSTVDYDIELFFDKLDVLLRLIPAIAVSELSYFMPNILGVNDRNEKGWSPIIVAAYHGRKDIIEFLLEKGADINDRNYHGTTVLMYAKDYALKEKDSHFIPWLLQLGADPGLKDWSEKSIDDYITKDQADFLGLLC
ncbi:formyltransferase family protein [Marinomonas shanghaiensis]|uniref:formyltransferase family protein n=1 Tax=Marinomonas shanghaiensis TaxID=2202418 RepID=UPI000DB9A21D|nr:formyltransferase family protein [Marinomonas shanghaiensis]